MYTVELLLDPLLESGVRLLWDRLHQAGLPSLATHRHPTNRPHLTVLTAASLAGLPTLPLPIPVRLGQVRILGRALVREVTRTDELRDLQARSWSSLGGSWPPPSEWTPHVSLALNVPADRHETALDVLTALPPVSGHFVAARSYDTEGRTVTDL